MASLKYNTTLSTHYQETTVASTYTASDTLLVVGTGSVFPTGGDFWVAVGDSDPPDFILKATARGTGTDTNTLTVAAAGADGTTPANTSVGTKVRWVLGPAALDQLRSDICQRGAFADRPTSSKVGDLYFTTDSAYYPVLRCISSGTWTPGGPYTIPPRLADITEVKDASANITKNDTYGPWNIRYDNQTSDWHWARWLGSVAAGAFDVKMHMKAWVPARPPNAWYELGLILRTAADSKTVRFGWTQPKAFGTGGTFFITKSDGNSYTLTAEALPQYMLTSVLDVWFRVADDTTNRKSYLSIDGMTWIEVHSVASDDFTNPDQGGPYVVSNGNGWDAGEPVVIIIDSLSFT